MPPLQRVADAARDPLPPPTRRQLLTGVAVVVATGVTGCGTATGEATDGTAADGSDVAADDDVALADRAARTAADLLAAYRATVRRHPTLRSLLDPLADHHAEHVEVFAPDTAPRARAPQVSRRPGQALAALGSAERRTVGARRRDVLAAASGDLARALASAVACQEQHLVLLDGAAR